MRTLLCGLAAPILLFGAMGQARCGSTDQMYWGDYTHIRRASFEGNGQRILVTDQNGAIAIALDVASRQMYWTDGGRDIRRANLDGSGEVVLVSGQPNPQSIALDLARGHLYWTNFNEAQDNGGEIWRANLDGSEGTLLVSGLTGPCGIALNLAGGQMYWTETNGGTISRANLDGTGLQVLVFGLQARVLSRWTRMVRGCTGPIWVRGTFAARTWPASTRRFSSRISRIRPALPSTSQTG